MVIYLSELHEVAIDINSVGAQALVPWVWKSTDLSSSSGLDYTKHPVRGMTCWLACMSQGKAAEFLVNTAGIII